MTWTFSNNPAGSNRDLIRTLISDTNTSRQILSDEFIAYAVAQKPNVYLAASLCAETMVSSTAATSAYLASNVTKRKWGIWNSPTVVAGRVRRRRNTSGL